MLKTSKRMFGEILVTEGILSKEQLDHALEEQSQTGMAIADVLLRNNSASETDIVRALSIQYQLPFLRPSGYGRSKELIEMFSGHELYRNRVVPLDRIGSCCIVAIADIPSEEFQQTIAQTLGEEVMYYFAPISDVENVVREHFALGAEDILTLNSERAPHAAPPPSTAQQLFQGLDSSSWESIFDEADRNIG